uniref:RNA-directed DNA polymerase, eukaryota, reverse transcriptase zinc-binding domain protein n=1 Tax=Tanacetum cinerariifolium TaxID=118510 RepID=A0A6L2KZX4_TANCI|nr:RNA-directed DNA polymerase, eukaryota, reverse transcriptase zinc-binding domain protein [Tanacetum cinerariifolium]
MGMRFPVRRRHRGLLFKWIWRFMTQSSSLWSKVITAIHGVDGKIGTASKCGTNSYWSNIIKEVEMLSKKDIRLLKFMQIKVGNGDNTRLWEDLWHSGVFPFLFADCRESLNHSGEFSVALVRKFSGDKLHPGGEFKTNWCRYVPIKVNIHAWKIMSNALATKFNISSRGIEIESLVLTVMLGWKLRAISFLHVLRRSREFKESQEAPTSTDTPKVDNAAKVDQIETTEVPETSLAKHSSGICSAKVGRGVIGARDLVGAHDSKVNYADRATQKQAIFYAIIIFTSLIIALKNGSWAVRRDLLSTAGLVHEAWDFIQKMPEKPNEIVLGALLGACQKA